MGNILSHLEPNRVWQCFEEICQYPHPSKKEDALAEFLWNWAQSHGFEADKDARGNMVFRKPATPGMENRKPVAIQGHIDMVCEKNSDVAFDFDTDAIQPWIDDGWVKAKGTTLGADNGIGVAMAMAVFLSDDVPHPPMEMLLTLDEETGLTGAMELGTDLLRSEILINLDSEEDGAFTIGCAGGQNTTAIFPYVAAPVEADSKGFEIALTGLRGGHSGIEIHDGRGNALKFMNRLLHDLGRECDLRLSRFDAGNKHNAIPREAFAHVCVPANQAASLVEKVKAFEDILKVEYGTKEPGLSIKVREVERPERVLEAQSQADLIKALYAAPHGVYRMSPDIAGLVQTSNNMAVIETRESELFVLSSERSSVESEKLDMSATVRTALELGGAQVDHGEGYPAWQPNVESPILNTAVEVFEAEFGRKPKIEAIHAGLECGLIGEKYPGMDMLSFGPNLKEVHSPDERLEIASTQRCFQLLVAILKNIPEK